MLNGMGHNVAHAAFYTDDSLHQGRILRNCRFIVPDADEALPSPPFFGRAQGTANISPGLSSHLYGLEFRDPDPASAGRWRPGVRLVDTGFVLARTKRRIYDGVCGSSPSPTGGHIPDLRRSSADSCRDHCPATALEWHRLPGPGQRPGCFAGPRSDLDSAGKHDS